jgi:hypothetical protein
VWGLKNGREIDMSYRKSLAAIAAASLVAGGGLLASAPTAEAQWRRGWGGGPGFVRIAPGPRHWGGGPRWGGPRWGYGHRRGWGGGGAVAAGLIGGLALGAIAASAAPAYGAPVYYADYLPVGYVPAYGGYAPAYYDGYSAAPIRCWWQRQRVPLDPWTYQVRRVRVCR